MIKPEELKSLSAAGLLRWTNHVLIRMIQRGISIDDIVFALQNGEIIEQYHDDYPYPSCLVLAAMLNNDFLHIVCGLGEGELWLITAYRPSPKEWSADFRVRKGIGI